MTFSLNFSVPHCNEFRSKGAVYSIMVQNIVRRVVQFLTCGYKISLILSIIFSKEIVNRHSSAMHLKFAKFESTFTLKIQSMLSESDFLYELLII